MGNPTGLERVIRRIGRAPGRGRVPVVHQVAGTDCGPACLTMVLQFYGRKMRIEEVRRDFAPGRDGIDAAGLLAVAERYGLRGRGVRVGVDKLAHLPRGAVLHWNLDHFVVFERVTRAGVEIVDPASGRRCISPELFSDSFTGVALCLEPTETFERRGPGQNRLWAYARPLLDNRPLLARVVLTSILLRVLALAAPILTAVLVDHVVPRSDTHLLVVLGVGLAGIFGFLIAAELIRSHLLLALRTVLDTRLTIGFLAHLVALPFSFFQRRSAGDLMMRVASNANIRETLTSSTLSAVLDGCLVLAYVGVLSWIDAALAGLTFALGLTQILLLLVTRQRVADLKVEELETQASTQGYLAQMLGGIETLKAAGAERRAVETWSNRFVDELNVALARGRLQAVLDSVLLGLRSGSPFVVLSFGALLVIEGKISLGTMLAANALALGFLQPLSSLVDSALRFYQLRGYVERIDDVFATDPEQTRGDVVAAPRLSGRIRIRDLSFRYDVHSPLVLQGVNLDIEPGQCVAVVGRSGSGKSTLASLLLGLHRPTGGSVTYDGVGVHDVDLGSLRRQIGVVVQNPYIFGQSIRENIALVDPSARLDAVTWAARRAAVDHEISAMPLGYDTLVSDGGSSLSGGQRQRIALARALLSRPKILVLDEATSALDTKTERAVMDGLAQLQCVRVIVAHRLSTIAFADKIVVMEEGRVVDVGPHAELLGRCAAYRELVEAGEP